MIPRGTPDLSWSDLLAGALAALQPGDGRTAQADVEARWSHGHTLASLSVRSGFDLVLQALAFPPGSEVLVSAVTIPGMLEIIERHDLVAVPLDLDPYTLAVDARSVEQAIGPRTRAIVIAHLFGSLMPLDEIAHIASNHRLCLLEDCAQAYDASAYRGHPASDVSLFSFGPIKTATALGGALLRFKDRNLLATVRTLQSRHPQQGRLAFAQRVALFALLKLLSWPPLLGVFIALCTLRGIDYDDLITSAVRGFSSGDLLVRIRRRPSAPLLRLLKRRIAHPLPQRIEQRIARAQRVMRALPSHYWPGAEARHSSWIVPVMTNAPDDLVKLLRACGFDATRRASSLIVITHALHASQMLDQIVYLPVYPHMTLRDEDRLCRILKDALQRRQPV